MYRGKNREEKYLFKELMPPAYRRQVWGTIRERESVVEDQGDDTVGRAGSGVWEVFFGTRAAGTGRAAGDRVTFVEAYEREK